MSSIKFKFHILFCHQGMELYVSIVNNGKGVWKHDSGDLRNTVRHKDMRDDIHRIDKTKNTMAYHKTQQR